MATIVAPRVAPTLSGAIVSIGTRTQKSRSKVETIKGMNPYGGLKAHDSVASLGMPVSTEQCFAKVVSSLKKGRIGGALSSKCGKVDEIFQIAAIINGLVLIGVAVGFVLLRMETSLEEAE